MKIVLTYLLNIIIVLIIGIILLSGLYLTQNLINFDSNTTSNTTKIIKNIQEK